MVHDVHIWLTASGYGVVEVEFIHLTFDGIDNDDSLGDGEHVFAWFRNLIGEVGDYLESHIGHLTLRHGAGGGVGERGGCTVFNLSHIGWEGDGEVLQALHLTLCGVDGDLVVEAVALDAVPEEERIDGLPVVEDGVSRNLELVVARLGDALLEVDEHGGAFIVGHDASVHVAECGHCILVHRHGISSKSDDEALQAFHLTLCGCDGDIIHNIHVGPAAIVGDGRILGTDGTHQCHKGHV